MNRRTKSLQISPETRRKVEERDSIDGAPCCVFCGTPYGVRGEAHYIKRSQGGLGIEQNLLTVCRPCHHELDFGRWRDEMLNHARRHFESKYEAWNEDELKYKRDIA